MSTNWSYPEWINKKYADEEYLTKDRFLKDGALDVFDDIKSFTRTILTGPFVYILTVIRLITEILFFPLFMTERVNFRYEYQQKRNKKGV